MKRPYFVRTILLAASLLLQLCIVCFQSRGAAGDVDLSFDPGSGVNGPVQAVAVQPDGKILIAGQFTTVKGLARSRVARLNADGSGDSSFDAGTGTGGWEDYTHAIALQSDGKVLLSNNAGFSRLNSDGSPDANFVSSIDFGCFNEECFSVYSIVVQSDGKLLLGGYFSTLNGTNRYGNARLNADGSPDSAFVPASFNPVVGNLGFPFNPGWPDYMTFNAFAVQPDGKVIITGIAVHYECTDELGCTFSSDGYFVTRHHPDGSRDLRFAPALGYRIYGGGEIVRGMSVQPDGRILLLGNFHAVNGTNKNGIARLNADGTLDNTFIPAAGDYFNPVRALQPDGKMLLGYTGSIERRNPDGNLDTSFGSGTGFAVVNGAVRSIALQSNGNILIGGDFTTVSGVVRPHVARLYGDCVMPELHIASLNGFVTLSWPVTGLEVQLEETTDLSVPDSWSPVAQLPTMAAGETSVSVPTNLKRRFFRLRSQSP